MSDPTASAAGTAPTVVEHAPQPAGPEATPSGQLPTGREQVRSLGRDAWEDLRRNPVFLISAVILVVLIVMAVAPGLFTSKDPRFCDSQFSRLRPSGQAWFGYDVQGCDVYARTIYGARASIIVGVLTTLATAVVGALVGMIAGFYGRWVDALLSRVADIFFAIPLLLGGILVLVSFPSGEGSSEWLPLVKVVIALAILGWPSQARIMRSSVIQVKQLDYVQAARALGAGPARILRKHILPNSLAPVIVVATIALGGYIGAEATLSFLGIGLQPPVISWGIAISDADDYIRTTPHMLAFPGLFLSITVLAFIMLGDAVRDALDPKLR